MTDAFTGQPIRSVTCFSIAAAAVFAMSATGAFAGIAFDDVTTPAGFSYQGESYGASWGDLNGDGWPDLFNNNHQRFPGLYINNRDGTFTDEAYKISTWTNAPTRDQHGGTWADFDNDGDSDLMVTTGRGSPNQFFVNQGGTLVEKAAQFNLANSVWAGRQGTWFDYDNDGKLDVIVGNFNGVSDVMRQASGTFVKTTSTVGADCTQMPYGQLLDVNRDGIMELLCGRQGNAPYRAYKTNVIPFVDIKSQIPPSSNVADTVIADFDNNLLQDIFFVRSAARAADVAQAGNRHIEATLPAGNKGFSYQASGIQTFDVDWRILRDKGLARIRIGASGYAPAAKKFALDPTDSANWGMPAPNTSSSAYLYIGFNNIAGVWTVMHYTGGEWSSPSLLLDSTENLTNLKSIGFTAADGPFAPVLRTATSSGYLNSTNAANLSTPISCKSAAAADLDNDMDVDLYVACASGVRNLSNRLYENRGNGVFDLVANAGGAQGPIGVAFADGAGTADSVVAADYDLDGAVDLFVTNGLNMDPPGTGGPVKLFHNKGGINHWIQLDLIGTESNRDGIGARVIVTAGGVAQLREQNGGYHRWSQDFDRIHFGLAGNTTANVRVEWPSGHVDTHNDLAADRVYRFTENGGYAELDVGQAPGP